MKNYVIIDWFKKLVKYIQAQIDISPNDKTFVSNTFRLKQIKNALDIITKYPKEIKSGKDLAHIDGIGKGTVKRIDEILETNKLSEIVSTDENDKLSNAVEELSKVHGIGQKKAYELVTKYGIKSIDELERAYNDGKIGLNNIILTGLKYHKIYQQHIPRQEIDKIKIYLKSKIKDDMSLTICGSYRRKSDYSNDIDVLLTSKIFDTQNLLNFVDSLKKDKFIIDDLTDKDYKIKYMGYCKYKLNPIRRIDIRYVPLESYATALLYFTGSGNFNRKMRSIAEQLGYLLNEYGLYKLKNNQKIKVNTRTEKDVFDKLNMEYLSPEKRK